ncbi:ferroxidase fet3 [Globomyces sp. JEL0801]|nr:ferroxidase fet3 [Globomyces sp. JEL0801]
MLLTLLLPTISLAATVVYDWNITYVEDINPDNQFPRKVIGVNNKWPLPPINATINDTLIINVYNGLDVPSALHTHGFFHNKTNYNDGAPGITECGIAPGSKLTYNITVEQAGTYWIHGHWNGQYVDGLQAPVTLFDPTDVARYKYDEEYVLSLTDWYHEQHKVLIDHFLSIYNPTGAEPSPDSALINHGLNKPLKFVPGKTYRLRIVSMASLAVFNVHIDDHKMKIIEVDGELVEPYEVDVLPLATAQRYSVLVTAKEKTDNNYYLHAKMDPNMLDTPSPNPNATVLISYKDNAPLFSSEILDYPSDPALFDEMKLTPITKMDVVKPDASFTYDVNFELFEDATNHGTFNQNPFVFPKVPAMFSALSMGENASNASAYGPRTGAAVLKHMEMVQIVINNKDAVHLHGHKFQVVYTGVGAYYDEVQTPLNITAAGITNPVRRDTVVVPGEGYTVLRFRADNPGAWFMHCHIEWHLKAGLATVFIEAPELMQKNIKVPKPFEDQCRALNMSMTGNAAGFNDLVTFTGIPPVPSLYPTYMQTKGWIALAGIFISAIIGLFTVIWYASFDKEKSQ